MNDILSTVLTTKVTTILTSILTTILSLSVLGSLLAGVMFLIKPLIKNKVSKTFTYYLWIIVLLRLCLPFGVSLFVPAGWLSGETSITNSTMTDSAGYAPGKEKQTAVFETGMPEGTELGRLDSDSNTSDSSLSEITSENPNTSSKSVNIKDRLFVWLKYPIIWLLKSPMIWLLRFPVIWIMKFPLIWLIILAAGAIFSLAWNISGYIRFVKILRRTATEPDKSDIAISLEFPELCEGGSVRFMQSEFVRTPMLVGILHPTVVTPAVAYSKSEKAEYLRNIFRHELTHYRRKDMIYKWFAMFVTSLHWFNPLMILLRREINHACELSCDEAVIGSLNSKQKQQYGDTLLSLAAGPRLPVGILSTTMYEEKAMLKERLLFIMNYKTKKGISIVLSLAILLIFMGCGAVSDINKTDATGSNTTQTTQKPQLIQGDITLYERYGLKIAIPKNIIDRLIVITEPKLNTNERSYLLTVYEKRSYEAVQADYGTDSYGGRIFSIVRYTQAQYEQFLCSDGSGQSFFAKDDTYYYGWFIPTDVQFYVKGSLDMNSDEWKSWIELNEKCNAIKEDFVARNNLKAYSDREFWDKEYTYDSEHLYFLYYPYHAYTGSKEVVWELVLSQPVKQGDTGIWCVERWKDQYGHIYPYFPNKEGTPSGEYYAALQAECDAGRNTTWLEPEQVALAFVKEVFDHSPATLNSFTKTDKPTITLPPGISDSSNLTKDTDSNQTKDASMSTSSGSPVSPNIKIDADSSISRLFAKSSGNIHDYMPKLLAGEPVSDYELLPCLENFKLGIWNEFNKNYGTNGDWWNALWKALNDAAVSNRLIDSAQQNSQENYTEQDLKEYYIDQALRDYYIGKAFLAADGAYSEGLSNILMRQWEFDRVLYSTCLKERFSEEEANVLRLSLTYSNSYKENFFRMFVPGDMHNLCLDSYPVDFPFGCNLIEKSRETFRAESFGQTTVVESDGLQVTYLHPYEGVYTITTLRARKKGYAVEGAAIGDTEELLLANWPNLKKQDQIVYDNLSWFDRYDTVYAYTPGEGVKSIAFFIKDGVVIGIELINGLDGAIYR